jgi:hypothetical protein
LSKLFDIGLSNEEKAASTAAEMALEEKVSYLLYGSAAILRLGISADFVRRIADVIGDEVRSKYNDYKTMDAAGYI